MGKGLDKLKQTLEAIQKKEARVGFFETSTYPDGTPVAYVAAIQEFGHGKIPPRPFMRPAQQQNESKWLRTGAHLISESVQGSITPEQALDQIGQIAAGDVRKAIRAVTTPTLSERTVEGRKARLSKKSRKKANPKTISKPLVDTGQMLQAVNSVVVTK